MAEPLDFAIPTRKHLLILGGWNPMEELLNDPDETIFDYPLMGQSRVTTCGAADLHIIDGSGQTGPRPTSITIRPAQYPDHLLSKGLSAGWVLLLKVLLIVVLFYAGWQVCSHVEFMPIPGVK